MGYEEVSPERGITLRVLVSDRVWQGLMDHLPQAGIGLIRCQSARELLTDPGPGEVALLDWARADGLLSAEHVDDFRQLCDGLPVILLAPRAWAASLRQGELPVAAIQASPIELHALVERVRSVASSSGSAGDGRSLSASA